MVLGMLRGLINICRGDWKIFQPHMHAKLIYRGRKEELDAVPASPEACSSGH